MLIHNWLSNNISWYRAWHQKPYANFVHFIVLIITCILDIYLAYELWESISQSSFLVMI